MVNVKQLLKVMPGMFEHSDKNVRAEVKGGLKQKACTSTYSIESVKLLLMII